MQETGVRVLAGEPYFHIVRYILNSELPSINPAYDRDPGPSHTGCHFQLLWTEFGVTWMLF